MDLVVVLYEVTVEFPDHEKYGLTSQLRRAGVSIPSNIAEGQGRQTNGEFRNFLSIAKGSLAEVETQLLLAERLSFIHTDQATSILERTAEIGRLINGLTRSLKT